MPYKLIAAITVVGSLAGGTALAQPRTQTVYVSATDKKVAVTDLQAADFEVKVGGKLQEVVSAKPSTTPLRIAILVADGGTGVFQQGVGRFMQKLLGKAEFALTSVIVQPEKIVDYSAEAPALSAGLNRLGVRGRQNGAQLMEAILETAKQIKSEGKRPVIVALRIGGEDPTQLSAGEVRDQLRKSGAILYVLSTGSAARSASSTSKNEENQLRASELAESANNLEQVLGDGSKDSGGRHDQIVASSLGASVEQLADELLQQYEVTYTLPDNVKAGEKISVASKRKGVTLRAPARLAN